MPLRCQKCPKAAVLHITEIVKGEPREVHLCEDCARQYLTQSSAEQTSPGSSLALAQQLASVASAKELAKLDKQSCPRCGITFREFRHQGRLGCPHDYEVFKAELVPLLQNIHDSDQHCGKVPRRAPRNSRRQALMRQKREELKQAIQQEAYERAAELRDELRALEQTEED